MIAKGKFAVDLGGLGHHVVGGNEKLHVAFGGLVEGGLGDIDLVAFHQRFADREAFGQLERVRHGTADQDGIGLFQ